MDGLKYPCAIAAREIIQEIGDDPEIALDCQDWEYTYPEADRLDIYVEKYRDVNATDQRKRVLCCFIFQACDDLLTGENGFYYEKVKSLLDMLHKDRHITDYEFDYWSCWDDLNDPDADGFHITDLTREYNVKIL